MLHLDFMQLHAMHVLSITALHQTCPTLPPSCTPTGTGDEELSGYLSALQAEADALQLSGKGAAADAALMPLAAAASELQEAGEETQDGWQ